ncbi:MAG: pyridoxal phosphate-dependent aminotransferase [Deltaproteobacteria bacterium]|nr:pyridoxal phosphate-dependent aminotransferase [Deltaproteobacteria bacterium]MBW1951930.1 pyridoxal phosphate-dependent aminotransferase [Deltaproteobacteria bacterium]MBW1986322.1 pyridoxal phosphate-dependent aminotransferase [Deltaproteobacteria bacterium]MBW2134364.1 pyridoxal phosphate-dependent aminotransferase [Deltaproteobacteria bacterium]
MVLAKRIGQIKPSPTLAIDTKCKALAAQGVDIVNFGIGEPDFDTPDNICRAAIQAIQEGFTRYTAVGGIPALKEAIIHKFKKDNNLDYRAEEIVVSCGGKHSLYNLFQVLFERGDEVIVPAPYWVSYPPMLLLAEAVPVIVSTPEDNGFKITPQMLREVLTPRTKGLILNSPSNPTGSVYTREELAALAEVILEHHLFVVSDDIYEKILFDGQEFVSLAQLDPELKARTFVLNGVSKTYAMTGWRIGYMAGPETVIKAVTKIQSQSTSNPNSIAQKAAIEALLGPQDSVAAMVQEFAWRRDDILSRLARLPGVSCIRPGGAFYVFPNFSHYQSYFRPGPEQGFSDALADYLLEEAHVAVVAGSGFGEDNCIRFSYATSRERIATGLERLGRALEKLSR